jgi:hypothetical protein
MRVCGSFLHVYLLFTLNGCNFQNLFHGDSYLEIIEDLGGYENELQLRRVLSRFLVTWVHYRQLDNNRFIGPDIAVLPASFSNLQGLIKL